MRVHNWGLLREGLRKHATGSHCGRMAPPVRALGKEDQPCLRRVFGRTRALARKSPLRGRAGRQPPGYPSRTFFVHLLLVTRAPLPMEARVLSPWTISRASSSLETPWAHPAAVLFSPLCYVWGASETLRALTSRKGRVPFSWTMSRVGSHELNIFWNLYYDGWGDDNQKIQRVFYVTPLVRIPVAVDVSWGECVSTYALGRCHIDRRSDRNGRFCSSDKRENIILFLVARSLVRSDGDVCSGDRRQQQRCGTCPNFGEQPQRGEDTEKVFRGMTDELTKEFQNVKETEPDRQHSKHIW